MASSQNARSAGTSRARNSRTSGRYTGKKKKSGTTSNLILVILLIAFILFTREMIQIFREYGCIPDTLCTCVYGAMGGELGILGWIRTSKEKYQEREWEKEDRIAAKKEAAVQSAAFEDESCTFSSEDSKYI